MILISILSIFSVLVAMSIQAHHMEHTCLNLSDLLEYATRLNILMIGILLFLENVKTRGFSIINLGKHLPNFIIGILIK